jgi:hypothetical protein
VSPHRRDSAHKAAAAACGRPAALRTADDMRGRAKLRQKQLALRRHVRLHRRVWRRAAAAAWLVRVAGARCASGERTLRRASATAAPSVVPPSFDTAHKNACRPARRQRLPGRRCRCVGPRESAAARVGAKSSSASRRRRPSRPMLASRQMLATQTKSFAWGLGARLAPSAAQPSKAARQRRQPPTPRPQRLVPAQRREDRACSAMPRGRPAGRNFAPPPSQRPLPGRSARTGAAGARARARADLRP